MPTKQNGHVVDNGSWQLPKFGGVKVAKLLGLIPELVWPNQQRGKILKGLKVDPSHVHF